MARQSSNMRASKIAGSDQWRDADRVVSAKIAPDPQADIPGTPDDDILSDTPDNDTISAGTGNDSITVTRGFDTVNGGADRDRLIIDYSAATQGVRTENNALGGTLAGGYSGIIWHGNNGFRVDFTGIEDFTVTTGVSNDNITTGDGDDVINLGGGDDFANFGAGNDSGDGGTGTDGFSANLGSATSPISINLVTNAGGSFSNFEYLGTLTTGSGNDTIVTRADVTAFETISTGTGADEITVARGFDNVAGGADRDRLIINYTGATQGVFTENNSLGGSFGAGYSGRIGQGNTNYIVDFTGIEDFTVTTGDTNDSITTGDGDDVINLGGGDDFANFGAGNDSGDGGTGTDGFSANLSSATTAININLATGVSPTFSNFEFLGTLTTGSGNDTIVTRGIIREEFINTGIGADTIAVAGGFDRANGGADRDRLIVDYTGATQGVSTDGVFSGSLAAGYAGRIGQGNGNYTVDFSGIEDFTVTTGGTNDNIRVFDGDDVVNVGGGDDFVNFGAGNDSGDGGSGTDGFSADLSSATTAISIDLVTGVSATFSNFEYLGALLTGSGSDTIVTRADVLAGETINTGAGADTITVARGFDNVAGGADRDRLIIDYSGATQNVNTDGSFSGSLAAGYTGRIGQGNTNYIVDFSGIEDFTVTTGGTDDNIRVFDGDDVVNLGGGNDFANFGAGNDSGDGGTGTDGFSADLSSDTVGVSINLVTGVSATFGNFEYLGMLTTGSGNDQIVTRGDVTAFETINTGAGADTITVARGFDNVAGGSDRDRLIIDYTGATQNVNTDGTFSGSLAAGYTGRIGQGNTNYIVDFSGIEDFTVTTGGTDDAIRVFDGDDIINTGSGNDSVIAAGGNDLVDGGAGNDTLDGGAGVDTLSYASASAGVTVNLSTTTQQNTFGAGLDTISGFENIIGSASADTLTGTSGGNVIDGAGGNDTIVVSAGIDTVNGGADNDTVNIDYSAQGIGFFNETGGDVSFSNGVDTSVRITAVERIIIATGGGNDTITTLGGNDEIRTNGGNDTLNGGAGADLMIGGSGNDIYFVDDAGDIVTEVAGEGDADEVRTTLANYQLGANVETLTYLGSASGSLRGNAGNNTIAGGALGDLVDLHDGGDDTVSGGGGDDGFFFGGVYTSVDSVDGGAGTLDQVGLQGDYSGGVTLGSLTGVEQIVLLSGADTRFGEPGTNSYSYAITATDAQVLAGQLLVITANTLLATENFTFDGSAEQDGAFLTYGGFGTELLTGGQQSDGFFFGVGRWGASDRVDGQGGTLDQLGLQGDYSGASAVVFGATQLTSIENIVLLSGTDLRFGNGGAGFDYDLTLDDANVLAGAVMAISANTLGAGETLTLDATAESDAAITVFSGAGDDTLLMGALGDTVFGGAGSDSITGNGGADQLTGGLGNDSFVYLDVADSTTAAQDHILDFATGDLIDLSAIDADVLAADAQTFTFIGSDTFTARGQLRASNVAGNDWLVEGDTDGDGDADLSILVTSDHALSLGDFLGAQAPQDNAPYSSKLLAGLFDDAWDAGSSFDHLQHDAPFQIARSYDFAA